MTTEQSVKYRVPVSALGADSRAAFISRTYFHLFGAILAFTAVEIFLFTSGLALPIARVMLSGSWLLVLGAFMIVGWLASRVASSAASAPAQYAALGGYVLAEAIIFVPLILIAEFKVPGVVQSAALVTMIGFTGLTAVAYVTRKDFSFLGSLLWWGGVIALVTIVAGSLFGFELGTFFSVAMIALAGGAILYDTSNVLHHYPEDRYVGAALQLFASVALLFWYLLRLMSSRR